MPSKSKKKSRKKTVRPDRKTKATNRGKESEYPNIIEEPIRVVGDQEGKESKAARARKKK